MKINVAIDERSMRQIGYIVNSLGYWDEYLHHDMADRLGKAAEERIKPYTRAKRSFSTGQSEQSVTHQVDQKGDGFEISFFGNLGAYYMDQGNFSPDQTLHAPIGNVREAFPIDSRFGTPIFSPYIHGMGHRTSGVPTHYSEKVASWLEDDEIGNAYLDAMEKWFYAVVIPT